MSIRRSVRMSCGGAWVRLDGECIQVSEGVQYWVSQLFGKMRMAVLVLGHFFVISSFNQYAHGPEFVCQIHSQSVSIASEVCNRSDPRQSGMGLISGAEISETPSTLFPLQVTGIYIPLIVLL
jgi:hypothetical protein